MELPVNSSPVVIPGFKDCLDGSIKLLIRILRKLLLVFGVEIFIALDQFLLLGQVKIMDLFILFLFKCS